MSKSFELFNQMLVIDDELYLDIQLHNAVKVCAKNAQNDFLNRYNKLGDLDTVIKKGIDNAHDTLEKAASMCVEFLTSLEIYNVSPAEILRQMKGSYFLEEFEQLEDWYVSLLNDEAQKDAYRTARRKNRSKWRSAGFGLNNAMAGAAQAGVLNLASGTVHGAVNLVGKSFSVIGASMSKGSMYKEASKRLANAIYMDVYDWIYLLESFIAHNGYSIDSISIEDERDAVNLFSNLKNMHVSGNQAYRIAFELFETNPCEIEYYEYCLKKFPEQQRNLLHLAEYCLSDAKTLVDSVLNEIYNSMPHKTEEQLLQVYSKLKEKQEELGVSQSQIIEDTEATLKKIDIDARTFRKVTFETREIKVSAEKDYYALSDICAHIEKKSKEECLEIKKLIDKQTTIPEVHGLFSSQIDQRIKSIELNIAKNKYNELFKKYSKNNKALSSYKVKKVIFDVLAGALMLIAIFAFILIMGGEWGLALRMGAVDIVLLIVTFIYCDKCLTKSENAAKESAPPELSAAWEEKEIAEKEYAEAQKRYHEYSEKFRA